MGLTRRALMKGAAAFAVLPTTTWATPEKERFIARKASLQLLPDTYPKSEIWGYDGKMPGPEIRLPQGNSVRKTLTNELPQATSTHWHGIRIDNSMDGVAGLTQEAVERGSSFEYEFTVPDAGTYWYHSHNRSFEQVARGLYGALIVEEPVSMDIDREEVLVLDDWLLDPDTGQIAEGFGAPHDLSHAGRMGNFIGTNGAGHLTLDVERNERLRLRLINASNARVFQLALAGLDGWIVALDGMPVPAPRLVSGAFQIGPAQRYDLVVDVIAETGESAHIARQSRDGSFSQVEFKVQGQIAANTREAPNRLPPNSQSKVDLNTAKKIELRMQGGAMGGLQSALLDGERKSMRELMQAQQFWAFNEAVGGIDGPPLGEFSLGESVRLKIINDTVFPHAMHLHGMHFWEILQDGSMGDFRDTTMVERGSTREIAFVADNPGDWLLHCHMLSHAASGMMAWVKVQA